jgi:hypothetical protein
MPMVPKARQDIQTPNAKEKEEKKPKPEKPDMQGYLPTMSRRLSGTMHACNTRVSLYAHVSRRPKSLRAPFPTVGGNMVLRGHPKTEGVGGTKQVVILIVVLCRLVWS